MRSSNTCCVGFPVRLYRLPLLRNAKISLAAAKLSNSYPTDW
jgi:hypothetical protein